MEVCLINGNNNKNENKRKFVPVHIESIWGIEGITPLIHKLDTLCR